jgi:glucose-6-phosphate isomerase
MASELHFYLNISREQALRYYQGAAKAVVVTTTTGQKLQFPAEHIRAFIDQNGISGRFSIQFDNNNKLIGLKRI